LVLQYKEIPIEKGVVYDISKILKIIVRNDTIGYIMHEINAPKPISEYLVHDGNQAHVAPPREDAYFIGRHRPEPSFAPPLVLYGRGVENGESSSALPYLRIDQYPVLAAAAISTGRKRKGAALVGLLALSGYALFGEHNAVEANRGVFARENSRSQLSSQSAPSLAESIQLPQHDVVEPVHTPEVAPAYEGKLALTDFWDPYKYSITPADGKVSISASLFIEKNTEFNYGWRQGAPGDVSTLMWNSMEAIHEFGEHSLKPGDALVFVDEIDLGDKLVSGETSQGEGYFGTTNGMCNASSTLGEIFGTTLVLPDGSEVPLFIAKPGSVQPHDMNHNPRYYNYAYHGPGVAVNSTSYGQLPFMVNPNIPAEVRLHLSMDIIDTQPENNYKGVYKPTVSLDIEGLPEGTTVNFQRLSANRTQILQRMTGSLEYYLTVSDTVYFDRKGNPIISDTPIVFAPPEKRHYIPVIKSINEATDMSDLQLQRFLPYISVPDNMINSLFYPEGFAQRAELDADGNLIWRLQEESYPIHPDDLPAPMSSISKEEYLRILRWNSVDDQDNARYLMDKNGMSFCNIAVTDWARAYRLEGKNSVPLPRWFNGDKLRSNDLFDWLHSYTAQSVGWNQLSSKEAGDAANQGMFTIAIAKNINGVGHVVVVVPGIGWESPEGEYYPNSAQAGQKNWGPDSGKTVADSFEKANTDSWSSIEYFVWSP